MPDLSAFALLLVTLPALAFPFLKGEAQKRCRSVIMIFCSFCLLIFFGKICRGSSHQEKSQLQIAEERAESSLKMMSIVNVGVADCYAVFAPLKDSTGRNHDAVEMRKTGLSEFFRVADSGLRSALKKNPQDEKLRAKEIVLLSVFGKQKAELKSLCDSFIQAPDDKSRKLGEALSKTFLLQQIPSASLDSYRSLFEKTFAPGWYRDNALLALYRASGNKAEYHSFARNLERRYVRSFRFGLALLTFAAMAGLAGVLIILLQLGSMARRKAAPAAEIEKSGLQVSPADLYLVFAGWMTSQLALSELLKLLPRDALQIGHSPVAASLLSMLSYSVSMIPAFALIYFVALRPRGLDFFSSLKIGFTTESMGPFRLAFCGFLGWCAIIPLVLLSSLVAGAYLGSRGSDNPILPQIAMIAGSGNIWAIGILALTVAVMAPFCEEIIFRGFLYAALRDRVGVFPAVILSALIFGGIHFDRGGFLMLAAGVGPVLAVVFERTRSVFSSMISHGLWNGVAFAVQMAIFCS